MPSSWSSSLRFELQFDGENVNTWGDKLNVVMNHVDFAIAGFETIALTGNYALTTANAADDQARAAMVKFTGAGPFTVTIPSASKSYDVLNSCAAALTLTTGAGATVALDPGEFARISCDAANVNRVQGSNFGGRTLTNLGAPINPNDAATKAYADALAFTANAGILPGQGAGTIGWFLKSNGANALWGQVASTDLTDLAALKGFMIAMAVSF